MTQTYTTADKSLKQSHLIDESGKILYDISDWKTEQSYGGDFEQLPESEGLYMIFGWEFTDEGITRELLYVGRATNLKIRCSTHEIVRTCRHFYDHVQVFFKETDNSKLKEKHLIRLLKPKLNRIHNGYFYNP